MAKVLGAGDVAAVVRAHGLERTLDDLIERLGDALAGFDPDALVTPLRDGFHYDHPQVGLLEWMPAMEVGRSIAIKTVGYHPANPTRRGLPTIMATTSVFDPTTGALVALLDATLLTALRTGAASAIATDVLARPGAVVLGVVGCGLQAVTQVHAISRVRRVETLLVSDVDDAVVKGFARRTAFLDRPTTIVPTGGLEDLLASSDVLCTCTSVEVGAGPVIVDGAHHPWLHVNAIGADFPGKQELPTSLLERALVCPDVAEQCRAEGESQRVDAGCLGPDLAALVKERNRHERSRDQLTVFDSTGWAFEDLVAAELLLDLAATYRIGRDLELQAPNPDPYDPYGPLLW